MSKKKGVHIVYVPARLP